MLRGTLIDGLNNRMYSDETRDENDDCDLLSERPGFSPSGDPAKPRYFCITPTRRQITTNRSVEAKSRQSVSAIAEFQRTASNSESWLHLTDNEINLTNNNIAPPSSHSDIREVNPAHFQQIHELWTDFHQGPEISVIESQMGYPLVHQGIQTFDGGSQMGQITGYNPIDNPEAWESFQNIITSIRGSKWHNSYQDTQPQKQYIQKPFKTLKNQYIQNAFKTLRTSYFLLPKQV
ncbi:hypothetical protein PGTUg99_029857 [Puccinia graminis f. sp. tritici]|uniref:Uncharacterized protein n=1 Tax=Puccinia graminis f. sp. tritici TaxID=56615 RepID=A0A5B0R8I1_PUCGR|nr:hypothetical protein PGTUg99_029857 [Puccinia graminis f. sp. tritici]